MTETIIAVSRFIVSLLQHSPKNISRIYTVLVERLVRKAILKVFLEEVTAIISECAILPFSPWKKIKKKLKKLQGSSGLKIPNTAF